MNRSILFMAVSVMVIAAIGAFIFGVPPGPYLAGSMVLLAMAIAS